MKRSRSLIAATAVALVLSLVATPVLADGALFIGDILHWEDLQQSSQKALILHGNSGNSTVEMIQHLILSVSFKGDVEDFAWVVPVPGIPAINVTDAEVFTELSDFTIRAIPPDPHKPGFGCPFYVGDGQPGNGVDVIDEQLVGPYATAILAASNTTALVNWLDDNGYYFPEEGHEVIAGYIEKEWYFVATRINARDHYTGKALAEGAIDPIVLSFESDSVVYPLRITSLSAESPDILLYILADHVMVPEQYPWRTAYGTWEYNVFSVEFADRVSAEDLSDYEVLSGLMASYLSGGEFYLTKLRGKVMFDEMVDIEFAPYHDAASLQWPARTDTRGDGIVVLAIIFVPVLGLYLWRRRQGSFRLGGPADDAR